MRLIIPESIKDYELFKHLIKLSDCAELPEYKLREEYELDSLIQLIKLSNKDLDYDNVRFIYNVILAKKGLTQVISTIAKYSNFDIDSYKIVGDNIECITIKSIVTDDIDRFLKLFSESLNALLFFNAISFFIELLTLELDASILTNEVGYYIGHSSYNELSYE